MLEDLTCACEGCGRRLDWAEPTIALRDPAGERRAYECACGAVTVTVART